MSTALRRLSYSVRQIIPAPLWVIWSGVLGIVSLSVAAYLSDEWKLVLNIIGATNFLTFAIVVAYQISTVHGLRVSAIADEGKELMNQGIADPAKHLRSNPELVKAHEALAQELGVSLSSTTTCPKELRPLYEAAMLVLSGRVAPNDSHMIITAVRMGIIGKEEIVSTVKEMKEHGALAAGLL